MNLKTPGLFYCEGDHEAFRQHAEALDLKLGFAVEAIEADLLKRAREQRPQGDHHSWGRSLHQGQQTWVGLSHQTLQTPYGELVQMCEELNPKAGEFMVDLGAGYGRLGLVLESLYPGVKFLGYEYVSERVMESNRLFELYRCLDARLEVQDLSAETFQVPEADYYLLYDYGNVPAIRKTLKQLSQIADRRKFVLIGRGKGTRSLIEHEFPWLTSIRTEEFYSIYTF